MQEYLEKVSYTLGSIWEWIKVILYSLFAFLKIDTEVSIILGILMGLDTLLGVIKPIFIKALKFEFKKLYLGIISKFVILLIPMILALIALGLGFDFRWAVEGCIKLLILSEGISIFTNIISIKEQKIYENRDYLARILHIIRNKLIKLLDKYEKLFKDGEN